MSTPASQPFESPRFSDIALAAVAARCGEACTPDAGPEMRFLAETAVRVQLHGSLEGALQHAILQPEPHDHNLARLHRKLNLSTTELLTVALAVAVDEHPVVGRALAHVQTPIGGSRPTLGLLAESIAPMSGSNGFVLPAILNGPATASGLLYLSDDLLPVPERTVTVPVPLSLALAGHDSRMPGATIGLSDSQRVPLSASTLNVALRQAKALGQGTRRSLVLRTGSPSEGRSAAFAVADALGLRPAWIETRQVGGFGPWLVLRRLLPVFCLDLGPGERTRLPELIGYDGPVLVLCGPDGSVEPATGSAAPDWVLSVPSKLERRALWLHALGRACASEIDRQLASELAADYRHSAGRIAHLAGVAHHYAAVRDREAPERCDVLAANWTAEGGGLDSLAQAVQTAVTDEAFVTPPPLRAQLDDLVARCRAREDLTEHLGASAEVRYRPGVRALFTGPSGTGKTLAASWTATQLGLPLYRVDLAGVTSKYIGETEKNLSTLLARAESSEVILLFDEADSLFGKRTDVNDANDRFANAQTNYLLQRIEAYDGIVLLTSNNRSRFDSSFTRRLDFLIDFSAPGPSERRSLWQAHLGPRSAVGETELNRLSVLVDISGGHIRNAVLAAAVRAKELSRALQFEDLLYGVEAELRKLGRQMPVELR